ncbi:MAG: hypothetical protein MUP49_05985 [Dehalococcoidia bacterium]|nr:hypothetical protein [Dehalococcoidia bacterium]
MGVENSSIRAEGKSELYQSACDEKELLPYPLGRPLYLLLSQPSFLKTAGQGSSVDDWAAREG